MELAVRVSKGEEWCVNGRVLAMGRAEARTLGIPWATVTRWKRRIRSGLSLENGHGDERSIECGTPSVRDRRATKAATSAPFNPLFISAG